MRMRFIIVGLSVVALCLAFLPVVAHAADLPLIPKTIHKPAATPIPVPSPKTQTPQKSGLHDADANCLEWTDDCRVCARGGNGQFACSNVGIACQPSPGRCTRR